MRMPASLKLALPLFLWLVFFSVSVAAQAQTQVLNSAGLFDDILSRYSVAASGWAGVITDAASRLFWTLVVISMVWTFGMMALRKADIGEFFAELVRFTIFTGFFWWLLTNGPNFASTIYESLRQVAGNATGLGNALSPSGIVDVGFAIFYEVIDNSSLLSPVDSMAGILMAAVILVVLALIGVNMLLLLASGWVLAYGGVFFLGFGGSRWTSDMAINYYKTVLGVAAQLMGMVLLVGIGKTFLDDYYVRMAGGIHLKEMGVMLVVCAILLALVDKVPALIAGIITGSSVGGTGSVGAGTLMAAAGMAAAGVTAAGAAMAGGAASAGGVGKAIMTAFSKASEMSSLTSDLGGDGGEDSGGGGDGDAGTSTPLAEAAGFSSGGSSSSSSSGSSSGSGSSSSGSSSSSSSGSGSSSGSSSSGSSGSSSLLASAAKNLAKGAGTVAAAKAESLRGSVLGRIAETTGGKVADAIQATGDWVNQTGGYSGLSNADKANASASHAAWKAQDPAGHSLGVEDYVSRVQQKKSEQAKSEQAGAASEFGGNSLSGASGEAVNESPFNPVAEVAAFVNRAQSQ